MRVLKGELKVGSREEKKGFDKRNLVKRVISVFPFRDPRQQDREAGIPKNKRRVEFWFRFLPLRPRPRYLHVGGHEDGTVDANVGLHGQPTDQGDAGAAGTGDALCGQIGRPGLLLGRQFGVLGQQRPHGGHVDLSARAVQLCGTTIDIETFRLFLMLKTGSLPCWTSRAGTGRPTGGTATAPGLVVSL